MKTKILFITLFLSQLALCQTIVKSSIDNGGASVSNANIEMLYTIGEVNVQEVTVGNLSISEGFIGPSLISSGIYIPDLNFEQALIDLGIDTDGTINQRILRSDAEAVTTLDVSDPENNANLPNVSAKIKDLTGIEAFVNLTELNCANNLLQSLNVNDNSLLVNLMCNDNELTSLDISNNSLLELLWCQNNSITSLNVESNPDLVYLITHFNNYSSINISSNTELYSFTCGHNPIENLDVTNNTKLEWLACNNLLISELDLSQNLLLDNLHCIENPNLFCIKVANESENHPNWNLDDHTILSNDCSYNTQAGDEVLVPLSQDQLTTVQYESVIQSGNTTLETGVVGPEIPEGFAFGDPMNYFNIETTASFTGAIEIAIYFGDMTYVKEDELSIMHYETDHWVNVTTSVNLASKTIYGEVFSLSPFVVVEYVNTPPIIDNIIASVDPIALGNIATVSVEFTDDNLREGLIDWGDGYGFVAGDITGQTITWNYSYPIPGVYAVTVKLVDKADEVAEEVYQYIVVYDPIGGFVTGGGWIDSPAGAHTADPLLAGKANFGFVSKYKKGTTVPTGNTEFQFKAGDLRFNSYLYDWLVIAGPQAKFKGEGHINGMGSYGFMLSAVDGQINGGGDQDKFRIKIWDKITQEVVYDNNLGAGDKESPTTVIGGGSIVIHSNKKSSASARTASSSTLELEEISDIENMVFKVYPNPVTDVVTIELSDQFKDHNTKFDIHLFDLHGIDILKDSHRNMDMNKIMLDLQSLPSGIYLLMIEGDKELFKYKLKKL